jgi:hypothetical protein
VRAAAPVTGRSGLGDRADELAARSSAGVSVAVDAVEDQARPRRTSQQAACEQIFDGLRFIAATSTSAHRRRHRHLELFSNIGDAIFPVYAYRTLGMTPATVGLIGGLAGAGILLGALVTTRIRIGSTSVGRSSSAAATGPVGLLVPIASPGHRRAADQCVVLVSICNVVYNVSQVSLRGHRDRLLGRMNASMRFLVWGTIPIGSLIGAGLSEVIGVQATIWVSAILGLFAFLPVLLSRVPGIQTIPTGEPEPSGA